MKTILHGILFSLFFLSHPHIKILCAQDSNQALSDTIHFTVIKTKDGNVYTGKIIAQKEFTYKFSDNKLGEIYILMENIKFINLERDGSVYIFTLNNGNKIAGKVTHKSKGSITVESTPYGLLDLTNHSIIEVTQLESKDLKKGKHYFANPNYTRYLFAPSAIPMKKGEGYYQNAYVAANSANYGVSNHFSLGGGIILPISVYITPKYGHKICKNFYLGAGAIVGLIPNFEEEGSAGSLGIFYGVATYGNHEHNITVGSGLGYFQNKKADRPILTFNGMTRVSERVMLVTENWLIPYQKMDFPYEKYGYDAFFTYGARFMWKRFSIDAAFVNNNYIFDWFPLGIPYIDFVLTF